MSGTMTFSITMQSRFWTVSGRNCPNALEQQPIDEDNAKALILRLVAEQYAALGDEEYETNRLRRLFSAFECVAELNADLLKNTVSEVLVTRQNVKLRLKNGQVIERSDLQ